MLDSFRNPIWESVLKKAIANRLIRVSKLLDNFRNRRKSSEIAIVNVSIQTYIYTYIYVYIYMPSDLQNDCFYILNFGKYKWTLLNWKLRVCGLYRFCFKLFSISAPSFMSEKALLLRLADIRIHRPIKHHIGEV